MWKTFGYLPVRVPAEGGGLTPTMPPALRVKTRLHDRMPWAADTVKAHTLGVIDSGACTTAVPMWMLEKLGIVEGSKVSGYGASGYLRAHKARIGMEIYHDGRWQDLGTVDAIAPDTKESRNPNSGCPLLGLAGFFDRLGVCIDHAAETFQVGRAGSWN